MPKPPDPAPADALPAEPLRLGDHAALDFLNSVFTPQDEPVELLRDGAALLAWLERSGAVEPSVAAAAAAFAPQQLQRLAGEARALREWFRDLLFRWTVSGERAVRPVDIEHLNALLARGRIQQSLVRDADGLHLRTERPVETPASLLASLAAACAELLATHDAGQVRKCENPACTLWFADTKRGPRRRWCSMALCGNRMKVAAHRARQRQEPPPSLAAHRRE